MKKDLKNRPKLHVLLTKEEVISHKMEKGKIAVVFDVLLATTTISALLHYGAREIIPVMFAAEAISIMADLDATKTILIGESGGKTIDGFSDPLPARLKHSVSGKTVVLSTTNGTVAILKVSTAEKVYVASLLNADAVASKIATEHVGDTIVAVCAGSNGSFCMEDFYGAGYFINELIGRSESWELTDSAKAALFFYRGQKNHAEELLKVSRTGEMMTKAGLYDEVLFAAEKGTVPVVPQLEDGKIVVKGVIIHE